MSYLFACRQCGFQLVTPQPSTTQPSRCPKCGGTLSLQSSHIHRGRSSTGKILAILGVVLGGTAVICIVGVVVIVTMISRTFDRSPQTQYSNLMEGRAGFETTLTRQESIGIPPEDPPEGLFRLEKYRSPGGEMAAYVTPSPGDGRKHPAIIWVVGGFQNSIGDVAWSRGSPANDQSAGAFREAGIVMMFPSFRGGNTNPGYIEAFYGEVDDLLAAYDHLAGKDYVDPQRIYLGGHSTGGTLVMLAAASSDRFRAVFAFGPVDDVTGYGFDVLPFNVLNNREVSLRNPGQWLHAIKNDLFVFEGTDGNIDCLRAMQEATDNPKLHFYEITGANHFDILQPFCELLARKILADSGPVCSIKLSQSEIVQTGF